MVSRLLCDRHDDSSDQALADLKRRLSNTRWPDAQTVPDWSQGMPLAYTQELCAYWRAREALLWRKASTSVRPC